MAAADFFDFRIRGRGAHGAMPHMGVDPVTASAAAAWLQPRASLKWSPSKGGLGPNKCPLYIWAYLSLSRTFP